MKNNKKIVIGNWKMNPVSQKEAVKLFSAIIKNLPKLKNIEIVVCPPYIFIASLKKLSKKVALGAQDVFWQDKGAFTGEISHTMLGGLGVKYTIVGHSERRALGESNADVNRKIRALISSNITPVLCVGEVSRGEDHSYLSFVKTQIEECMSGISKQLLEKIIIAYEPVWAIGKSAQRPATALEHLEMSVFIRKVLSDKFGVLPAQSVRILYGGSVHPENAREFLEAGKADGFLPGRDSLDPKKFIEIIKICEASKN